MGKKLIVISLLVVSCNAVFSEDMGKVPSTPVQDYGIFFAPLTQPSMQANQQLNNDGPVSGRCRTIEINLDGVTFSFDDPTDPNCRK